MKNLDEEIIFGSLATCNIVHELYLPNIILNALPKLDIYIENIYRNSAMGTYHSSFLKRSEIITAIKEKVWTYSNEIKPINNNL